MTRPQALEIAFLVLVIALLSPANAWAYIDPGTGSYIFQVLIAGGVAGVYTLRRHWRGLMNWLTRNKAQD